MNASCFGRLSASASEPAEFTMPATSMLSLISTGMPCSGPRTLPALRSASSASASAQGRRVELDHRVQRRARIVDGRDAIEIRLRQRARRQSCPPPCDRARRSRSARRRRPASAGRPAPRCRSETVLRTRQELPWQARFQTYSCRLQEFGHLLTECRALAFVFMLEVHEHVGTPRAKVLDRFRPPRDVGVWYPSSRSLK